MKVFVFNGSRHRANSVCCMWIDQFMQLLKMSAPESIEFLSHGMENIQFCSGCQECFKTGMYLCSDSMNLIRSDMLASDVIVLVSPVYNNSISGSTKVFLDRISVGHTYLNSLENMQF